LGFDCKENGSIIVMLNNNKNGILSNFSIRHLALNKKITMIRDRVRARDGRLVIQIPLLLLYKK
jgi:hypothetical protein